jgi:DNA-binding transcriptional MerR regulator
MELSQPDRTYTADDLATLANVPRRTLRYYIQLGLVDRPIGETRAAYYTWQHLRQLLEVRERTEQGWSLERIAELQRRGGESPSAALAEARPGTVSVRSHIRLAPGVELVVEPGQADLNPEQLRRFARDAVAAYQCAVGTGKNNEES